MSSPCRVASYPAFRSEPLFVDVAEKAGLRHRFNIASVPDTNVLSSTFGKALFQGSPGGTIGAQGATYVNHSVRQVELGFKILF